MKLRACGRIVLLLDRDLDEPRRRAFVVSLLPKEVLPEIGLTNGRTVLVFNLREAYRALRDAILLHCDYLFHGCREG